ncbi:MAG: MaoC family dehydratase N-terminal domain-containing protein [Polaromonas sp.]|nr:MaoC family dehydratase N-terminal domain-containing protein [Polaromonas sp.]
MSNATYQETLDLRDAQAAVGNRLLERKDTITLASAEAFRTTFWPELNALHPGDPLPFGLHCLYFLPQLSKSHLRGDGTPLDNGLVPNIPLPRRMFASEEVEFHRPIRIGETLIQSSELESVRQRAGNSGPLVFATVRHQIGSALTSWQHTVFRQASNESDIAPAPPLSLPKADWTRTRTVDPVDLFRFSALTFNSHRIHYDLAWARDIEGYKHLVVHGQLVALLLLGFAVEHMGHAKPTRFRMRAQAPVFCGDEIELRGSRTSDGCQLWAVSRGIVVMQAEVELGKEFGELE